MCRVNPSQVMVGCWYFLWDLEDYIAAQCCLRCIKIPISLYDYTARELTLALFYHSTH